MDYDSKSADILETEGYKESGIFIKKGLMFFSQ